MARRQILTWIVLSLLAVGTIAAAMPFVESLRLNARSGKDLPRLDIADLVPGSVRVFRLSEKRGYGQAVVVTKDHAGSVHAFRLFMSDSRIGVPGASWTVNFWCDDFGAMGSVGQPESVVLGCKDEWLQRPESAQGIANSQWTLTGEGLGTWNADLEPARFALEQNELVIGKGP